MTFRPLHDRVLVEPLGAEEKSAGGIIIPDTAQEKPMEGKIVAVGNGYKNDDGKIIPLDVKAGDTVLYGKYAGTEVRIDGQDMLIVKESDILAVIEGKPVSKRKAA
jgi:chaperonin GroES